MILIISMKTLDRTGQTITIKLWCENYNSGAKIVILFVLIPDIQHWLENMRVRPFPLSATVYYTSSSDVGQGLTMSSSAVLWLTLIRKFIRSLNIIRARYYPATWHIGSQAKCLSKRRFYRFQHISIYLFSLI